MLNPVWQYYSYALGGGFAATVLGFLILSRRKYRFHGLNFQEDPLVVYALVLSIIISAVCLPLFFTGGVSGFIPANWATSNYTAAQSALSSIPSTANVSAQANLMPHLYRVPNLETLPYENLYWTRPDYIAIDPAAPYYGDTNVSQEIGAYMKGNYTLYASGGGVYVYKLKSINNT